MRDVNATWTFVLEFLSEFEETFFNFVFNGRWQLSFFNSQVGVFWVHVLTECIRQRFLVFGLAHRSGMSFFLSLLEWSLLIFTLLQLRPLENFRRFNIHVWLCVTLVTKTLIFAC